MAFSQSIGPSIPRTYFSFDNIHFLSSKITEVMDREYSCPVVVPDADIVKVMQRILEERTESIPHMNQRVIMSITNEIRNHQHNVNKHLKWEEGYKDSQKLADLKNKMSHFDKPGLKLNRGVGGTVRFYFT